MLLEEDAYPDAGIYTRAQLSEFWDNILQRCFNESFAKVLTRTHRRQHSSPWSKNNTLIVPHERTSMWTTGFPPATSRISLWTRLDQFLMSGIFVVYISLASCLSSSSLIS